MTTIHTRQLQQYTQDNNNTHKTTTTIHTRQLEQYTQGNYNNKHKTTTTIHTRQLKIQRVQKVNNTTVRKYSIQFPVFSPPILYSHFHPSLSLLTTVMYDLNAVPSSSPAS